MQGGGDLVGDRHAAAGQGQHHHIVAAGVLHELAGQLRARVLTVLKMVKFVHPIALAG
jgi:hypothetical protein